MRKDVFINSSKTGFSDVVPNLAGVHECESEHTFGPAIRDYYLLHYCISGKGGITDPSGAHTVSAGSFFIIRPGEVTVYKADKQDPWKYVWIGFSGKACERFKTVPTVNKYPHDTFLRMEESILSGIDSPEIYISYIYELLHFLFSDSPGNADAVSGVKNYIKYNYMNDISVENIAENAGLNRRYLSRIFKEKYGKTIKEYIIDTRCKKAAEFLLSGYTVTEAAFMAGYTDVFAFSKMFKKVTGTSPSEKKKENKSG